MLLWLALWTSDLERGRWFEPDLCRRVVSLDKKLYSTFSLVTLVLYMGTGDHNAGGNLAMD